MLRRLSLARCLPVSALAVLLCGQTVSVRADDSSEPTKTPAAAGTTSAWESKLERAEHACVEGNYTAANQLGLDALSAAPDDVSKAAVLNQMGVMQMRLHRFVDARKSFSDALELRRKIQGNSGAEALQTMSNLALAIYKVGDHKKAEDMYQECIGLKRKSMPGSASLAKTLINLGNLYSDEFRCPDAKSLYLEGYDIDRKIYGDTHAEVAADLCNVGCLLFRCHENKDAIDYLLKADSTYSAIGDSSGRVKALHYLSLTYADIKDYDKAADASLRSLEIHESLVGKGHPDTLIHLLNAAKSLDLGGKSEKAEQLYKQALSSARAAKDPSNLRLAECNLELAQFYRRHDKDTDAEQYFRKALVHYDELSKKDKRNLYEIPLAYSELLKQLKRVNESDQLAHRYLDVYKPGSDK